MSADAFDFTSWRQGASAMGSVQGTAAPGLQGRLWLIGKDAQVFLHGQCTQAVKGLHPGQGGYAFCLDPRGKVLSDLRFSVAREEQILLEVPAALTSDLRTWLERFIVVRNVVIADATAESCAIYAEGPNAERLVEHLAGASVPKTRDHHLSWETEAGLCLAIRDEDLGGPGITLVGPTSVIAVIQRDLEAAGVSAWSAEEVTARRIAAGTPRFGIDLNAEVLPEEAGAKARAVSFTKGCYCGQEAVAKQHFLGNPRKRLVQLGILGDTTPVGRRVVSGDKDLGLITSAAAWRAGAWIALAVLRGKDHPNATRYKLEGLNDDVLVLGTPEAKAPQGDAPEIAAR